MAIPQTAHQAIFPQPVVSGPFTIQPPTLLHLAALDRLGCRFEGGKIGPESVVIGGFVLTRSVDELEELMTKPRDDLFKTLAAWSLDLPAPLLRPLRDGVVNAVNAAFETAVPGDADPTTGRPPSSVGPSKSRRR